ncbi:uncharacterized protein NECHADRAFT_87928 [Fusarium vanettenii 77-13-4]|uniref:Uncharacterized protein n=1 Tax=Fusarium vanettenii (strain ATCC MYA-4622 / CBS 123669 / FGSC 9596 / NRRL 45880 / 77-13-4) TaxID=660122 RepID=C7ZJT6_FUSV7|nr:uncharacterized protein NECHADRAFT_87928 [Fusarium vanettenii 77-13-4]EEU35652.1 predicted protein [Fusarium vanettenii 77-13-4]
MAGDNDRASSCVLTRTLPIITTEACPGNGHGIATAFVPAGTQLPVPDFPKPGEPGAFTPSSHPTGANSGLDPPKNSNAADLEPGALSPDAPSSSEPGSQSGVPDPDASGVSGFPEEPGTNKQLDRPEQPGTPESPGSGSGSGTTTASGGIETPVVVGSAGSSIGIDQGIMVFAGLVAGLGPIVIR